MVTPPLAFSLALLPDLSVPSLVLRPTSPSSLSPVLGSRHSRVSPPETGGEQSPLSTGGGARRRVVERANPS